jgi:hypothetical protein
VLLALQAFSISNEDISSIFPVFSLDSTMASTSINSLHNKEQILKPTPRLRLWLFLVLPVPFW